MIDKDDEVMSVTLTAGETATLLMMSEFSLRFLVAARCPPDLIKEFMENSLPILNKLKDGAFKFEAKSTTEDMVKDLKLRFTDKNSPNDKAHE